MASRAPAGPGRGACHCSRRPALAPRAWPRPHCRGVPIGPRVLGPPPPPRSAAAAKAKERPVNQLEESRSRPPIGPRHARPSVHPGALERPSGRGAEGLIARVWSGRCLERVGKRVVQHSGLFWSSGSPVREQASLHPRGNHAEEVLALLKSVLNLLRAGWKSENDCLVHLNPALKQLPRCSLMSRRYSLLVAEVGLDSLLQLEKEISELQIPDTKPLCEAVNWLSTDVHLLFLFHYACALSF